MPVRGKARVKISKSPRNIAGKSDKTIAKTTRRRTRAKSGTTGLAALTGRGVKRRARK